MGLISSFDILDTNGMLLWFCLAAVALAIMVVSSYASSGAIPSVRFSTFGLDNISRFSQRPVQFLSEARQQYGEVFKVNLLFSTTIWLNNPRLNKEYLETREDVWSFGHGMGKFLNKIVTPEYWTHLKPMVGSLSRGISRADMLAHFQAIAEKESDAAIEEWKTDDSIELFERVSWLVHRIIVRCLMGTDFFDHHVEELFELLHSLEDNLGSIYNFLLPEFVPHPAARKLWTARARMGAIFQERMAARKQDSDKWQNAQDYIAFTLRDPSTKHLEPLFAAHHTLLMFAAHTSTVALIAWTVVELVKSQKRLPILRHHLSTGVTDSPQSCAYLSALLKETGRHYASISDVRLSLRSKTVSAPYKSDMALKTPTICSPGPVKSSYLGKIRALLPRFSIFKQAATPLTIPPNSIVSISPYMTHHDPQLWIFPDSYYPERWQEEDLTARLNNKTSIGYMPFGAGSHRCPGEKMALMIAKTVLGRLAMQTETIDFFPTETGRTFSLDELDFSKVGSPWLKGDVKIIVR